MTDKQTSDLAQISFSRSFFFALFHFHKWSRTSTEWQYLLTIKPCCHK